MMQATRTFMADEMSSDPFDDRLSEICAATSDQTVRLIGRELWSYYDDLVDHLIVVSKQEWDFLNRLLLVLASDVEIEAVSRRLPWHIGQVVAAGVLAGYAALAALNGFVFGYLVALPIFCGVVSAALTWFNRRHHAVPRRQTAMAPFSSVGAMLAVRRSVEGFGRRRYPQALAARRIRGPVAIALWWIRHWLVFSIATLSCQLLPDRETRWALSEGRSGLPLGFFTARIWR